MSSWPVRTLHDAGVRLIDCVHKTPAAQTEGFPYVGIPQMKDGVVDFSDARRISAEDYVEWTKKAKPQVHDVVLSRRTNPGVTATFGENVEFALGQNLVLLRADGTSVEPMFLRWLTASPYWWAEIDRFRNVGAVFDSLKCADVPKFQLPIPPKPVQQSIADLLGALQDKIELNRRMNKTLEAMAQAIFRDWFVDFGPVRRKMEGATDPAAIMGGLTPDPARAAELAALFPRTLGEDGLPERWSERPLDQIADFLNGLALQKFPAISGEPSLPVIKIAELRNGVSGKSNRAASNVPEKYIVRDGDYLFSWSGSLVAKVWAEGKGALNQHLFKVSSKTYPQWFYGAWVERHLPEFQRIAASKATTMGHIQRSHLTAAMTVCPPPDALEKMSSILAPLWDRRIHNDLESRTLAETRDYLLPRLMSGAVKVENDAVTAQ